MPKVDYDLLVWGPNTSGMDAKAAFFSGRVDGAYKGTTEQILRWGACKWGFDEDTVKAVAIAESWWNHDHVGDNGESFGIMQVRPIYHPGTAPAAWLSTAFNVDYTLAGRRACFEGYTWWLNQFTDDYKAGDDWGCIGLWFSGRWKDAGALDYIATVKKHTTEKVWLQPWF